MVRQGDDGEPTLACDFWGPALNAPDGVETEQLRRHPGAGVIDAETTVHTMVELALAKGAQVRTGWEVRTVTRSVNGFRPSSSTGEVVEAEHIMVCAGGWLPAPLGDLSLPAAFLQQVPSLQVRQEQAYHFPYREVPGPSATPWPTFIHKSENLQAYGPPGGRDARFHGQEVAEFNGGKVLSSAQTRDRRTDDANRQRVEDYVTRCLPGVVPEPYAETTCPFTDTPNEDFVLDTVDGITVVSPVLAPRREVRPPIGEMAADLATGRAEVPGIFRGFDRDPQNQWTQHDHRRGKPLHDRDRVHAGLRHGTAGPGRRNRPLPGTRRIHTAGLLHR